MSKKDIYVNRLQSDLWHVNVYLKDQNIMQKKDLMELNFEGLEMQKGNLPTDRA